MEGIPTLRLNEHYTSVQGEGPHVGKLTQFVRFSGCNMRCPGWPCDTPHAIYPALWKNDPKLQAEGIFTAIMETFNETGAGHVCLTGGEPMLQNKDALRALIEAVTRSGLTVDMFSNGSFSYPRWLLTNTKVTIVMDWKLPGSGEGDTRLEERWINRRALRKEDAVKFVVKDLADLEEARKLTQEWATYEERGQLYVGAVWGEIDDDYIVQYIQEHRLPWMLNVQVHKHIWGEKRGV